ncbi:non-ribosomal peptide synthetase [Okeania sp. SIO2C9]|uniref:non-ribosomal peptide synthetase n=1 Tax=Okeania sp. SIO2C9 TaxID=2607791 RepID=UPI0025FAA32D|nr:non-ribosomal peptide synthetase [Okeania sp. SIO2C9]
MNLVEFLQDISLKGVKLWRDGEKLRTGGSQEVLTPDVIAQLKQNKTQILQLLQEQPDILQVYPLSYGQKNIWFLWKLAPQSHHYNLSFPVRIYSQADIITWQQTFKVLRERHPLLRGTFPKVNEKPVLQVHQNQELDFLQIDATTWSENELHKRVTEAHQHPFDLEKEPVMRVRWFICSEEEQVLLLTIHHIALDGWSTNLIFKELPQLYQAQRAGVEASLPELKHSYQDYVSWQRELVESQEGEKLWNYWQQKLTGELPVLNLPTDRQRPPIQTYNGGSYALKLSEKLTKQLKTLAQKEGATLYMILLAVFQVLLSRYSGQEDIVVGSPTFGRSKAEFAPIVGYFVDSVVMRADLSGNPCFTDFLSQVRYTVLEALAHQDYPFGLLVERLQPQRDSSRSPIFQVSFLLQNFMQQQSQDIRKLFFSSTKGFVDWGGLKVEPFELDQYESLFDLLLEMVEEDSYLLGFLKYNTDLFDEQTIARMAGHFENLLESIVSNSEQRVGQLPLLNEAEKQQLLVEWNNTKIDYPADKCIHEIFETQVEKNPEAVAVVFEEQKLTYSELNSKANQLAHYLQHLGVKPEVLVGICYDRSVEMVIALLATLKAGGAYVPIDPNYPPQRLAYMLADAEVLVLLTTPALMKLMPEHQAQLVCWEQDGEAISSQSIENPLSGVNHQNLAYVIYTSGSTGKPKGAMNTHGGICNRLLWMQDAFGLTSSDKILQKTPFSFDVSVWEFFWPLLEGATLVVAKPEGHKDSGYLKELIVQEKITTLHFVPSMLKAFLLEDKLEDCSSLKRVICSGEALSVQLQEKFFEKLGCELHNLYGPTEAAIDVTWWPCVPDKQQKIIPIGRPIANTQMYILDRDQQPVPIGVAGELHIAGAGLARGYLKREELTQQKFIPNPFDQFQDTEKSKLYKTGDLARYLPDGNIEFLGRIDHQVKMRGFRIELGEIESAIEENPGVEETVVTLRENQVGQQQLVAYLVPNHQGSRQVKQLLQWEQEGRLKTGFQYQLPNGMVIAHLNQNETDFLYQEIFENAEYFQHGIRINEGDCIFDVGANIGMFSLFAAQQAKNLEIFAFEPIPPVFKLLEMNTELYGSNVKLFECGLSNQTRRETFTYYPENSVVSGLYADQTQEQEMMKTFLSNKQKETGETSKLSTQELEQVSSYLFQTQQQVNCQLRTLSEVIREQGVEQIDLLKIDVEKSELEVLEGIEPEDWSKIQQIVVEVHDINGRLTAVEGLLKAQGYQLKIQQETFLEKTQIYNIYALRQCGTKEIDSQTSKQVSKNRELLENQLDSWQEIFNERINSELAQATDPLFNIAGWHNSYDNQPIPEKQMRVWANDIVTQVLAHKPQKVWEVGCGTGMLLFQIAPHTEKYYGTDISNVSLEYIKKQIEQQPDKYAHVTLAQKQAHDLGEIADNSFDIILLSSIVQYFPSIEYLLQVIENSIRVVKPGGMIFLGDIRSFPLMRAFHTSVQLYKASPSLSLPEIIQRTERQVQQEKELLLSPELFVAIKEKYPEISHVQIRLQKGSEQNELNKYRYDVLLHIEAKPANVIEATVKSGMGMSYEDIEVYLKQEQPDSICWSGIVNGRVVEDIHSLELLSAAGEIKNVQELRQKLQLETVNSIDPEKLYELSSSLGYSLELCWSDSGTPELIDAVFVRSELATDEIVLTPLTQKTLVGDNWYSYGNNPLASQITKQFIPKLREYLELRLPEYMIPNSYVVLSQLPLTPNGKVNRKALPVPDWGSSVSTEYVAPETEKQKALAEIWKEVLGIEKVGVHDNFFDLGGHSLMVTQVVSRVRQALSVELSISKLFESPTIAQLSTDLEAMDNNIYLSLAKQLQTASNNTDSKQNQLQPIERNGNPPPLSYAQQRLWFLEKMALSSNAYNMPLTLHIVGKLDQLALQKSLNQIIARHETLRTTFSEINGTPVQIIKPSFELKLPLKDLSELTPSEATTQLQQLLQQENELSFNLEVDPPIRAQLFQLGTTEYILQITLHHIASDGWSLTVLPKELSAIYTATLEDKPSPLPSLPIQYADFAVWQKNYLQGETLETQLNYWKQKLQDLPQLQLPKDHPRPPVQTFNGTSIPINIPAPLTSKLRKLTQQQGVTLFMTLLAAFKILLSRYSGQESIAVGSPIANRNRREIEGLIGFFVNSLVMYTDLGGDPSFTEVLNRVKQTSLEAYSHQDIPFEKLVEELEPERSLSQNPLFQIMFAVQQEEILKPSFNLPNLEVSWYEELEVEMTVRMDMEFHLWPAGEEIKGFCAYNTDLFEAETISRMVSHYQNLLSVAVETPEKSISQLPLITEVEREQLLVEWNKTKTDYPTDKCIHQLFEEQVEKTPDAVAVVFEEQSLTYSQLNKKANQLAHYLQKLGVSPETLVGVCVERSVEMVVGLLAILKAGGAYVPLDPSYPSERLAYMISDAQVSLLLTQESLVTLLPEHQAQIVYLDSNENLWSDCAQSNLSSEVKPSNLGYVIYTSGSTGKPKGVAMNQGALVNLLHWQHEETIVGQGAKTLQFAPISFDVSFQEIFSTWCSGGTLVLVSSELRRDPLALMEFLTDNQIERLFLPFVALQQFASVASKCQNLPQLREVITAGEQLQVTPDLVEMMKGLPNCRLQNQYGPSESHVVSAYTLQGDSDNWPKLPPIGRPIANAQLYVLSSEQQAVPVGVPGELYIGGVCLANGYLNRSELTAEKFIANPFDNSKATKLYKTGDLCRYLADGNIEILGRIDQQVKVRGYRIETGEIEALVSQYPDVKENVVIAQSDPAGGKRLVVYIVPKQESTQDTSLIPQVRQFLKQKLPEYMIPAAFVLLDAFPLTPSGKIDRRALPVPDTVPSGLSTAYVMPQTETEQLLAKIWQEVLQVEKVGIYDNFFELGGHSLLIIKVHTKLQEIYPQDISIVKLFQHPNISEFSKYLIDLEREKLTDSLTTGQAKARSDRKTSIKQQRLQRQKNRRNK